MNNKYFETDNNKYIVIENDKDLSFVKSNSDIKEILNLENDLEKYEKDLEKCNKNIEEIEVNLNLKSKFNAFLFKLEIFYVLLAFLIKLAIPSYIFISVLISSVSLDILATSILGTVKKNKKKLKRCKLEREVLLANIDATKIDLDKQKSINNYEKENIISLINNNYISTDKDIENTKVKKLVLKKPDES